MKYLRLRTTAFALAAAFAMPALADYPEKAVQGVIQWGAGGSTDTVMRSVTPHAEKALGQSIVLTNKTGGVGAIAAKFVMTQPADGYTVLMGAENPQLYKVMGLGDFDYSDFIPIRILARGVPIIVARTDAPYNTLKELVAYAEANPGKVKMGSTGPGGLSSVVAAMVGSQAKLPVTPVPYDGDGPALTALQGGAVDFMPVVVGAAIEHIKAGRMKVLTVVDLEPSADLPGIAPVVNDFPGMKSFLPWGPFFGVFAKKGTPDDVVEKLRAAFGAGVEHADFKDLMAKRGFKIANITGSEAEAFLKKWQSVTSWIVFEAGAAKKSPEEFGIPKP